MAHYYEAATKRLCSWISEDAQREDDFFDMPDVLDGETVEKYLARNACRPGIITETIERLMQIETNRAIKAIHLTNSSS